MSLCTHGVQTGEGYECSSCVTTPTFAQEVDTHLQRLAAERTPSVALVEERTEGLTLRDLLDGLLAAAAEPDFDVDSSCRDEILRRFGEHTGVSDVQAEVLEQVEALRREFREYAAQRFAAGGEVYDSPLRKVLDDESRVLRNSWLTRLDRITSAVRRGEQR